MFFKASRKSLGSREVAKNLRSEGFEVSRYKVMKIMARLNVCQSTCGLQGNNRT